MDKLKFLEKPFVDLGQFVDSVNRVTLAESLLNHKYTLVGRFFQSFVDIGYLRELVLHETMHPLPYHSETLLNNLLKCAAHSHHLTY